MKPLAVALICIVALTLPTPCAADSWNLPKKAKFCSANGQYCLEIVPKKLESQLSYFEDKVNSIPNAGGRQRTKDDTARGIFYVRRRAGKYPRRWKFPLVNEVSPGNAIVTNSGQYVVTFDNWHSMGYGDDVVVIYRSDGSLVRKLGLDDLLTEGDIAVLPRSVSSIWWGDGHYFDEKADRLMLRIVSNGEMPYKEDRQFHVLRVELSTGRPLDPKRDLFPQPRVLTGVEVEVAAEVAGLSPDEAVCYPTHEEFDSAGTTRISSLQMYEKARSLPVPDYPPLARAARVQGTVLVEALIAQTGAVLCARAVSGHPLFKPAAVKSALKWQFDPFETSNANERVRGILAITFRFK
jgi:TonB family protein